MLLCNSVYMVDYHAEPGQGHRIVFTSIKLEAKNAKPLAKEIQLILKGNTISFRFDFTEKFQIVYEHEEFRVKNS